MVTILSFIFVLGVLVLIHEFGHFIMAKLVGIRVDRFSIGFPPRMIGKKIGETDYCISWIPIGGYVKLAGMIDESFDKDSIKGEPWEFMSKPIYQRFLVILAGPLMNILLALFIFTIITYITGINEPIYPTVGEVKPNSYIAQIGLQKGDIITAINNQPVKTWNDVYKLTNTEKQLSITWRRGNEVLTSQANPSFIDSLAKTFPPIVGEVVNNYPAASIGIKKGDRIIKVNDQPIKTWNDLTEVIHNLPGKKITIQWQREGEVLAAETVPIKDQADGRGRIGISFPMQKKPVSFFHASIMSVTYSWNLTKLVYHSIKQVIAGEQSFKNAFGGPIVIAKMAGESARSGAASLFIFMAFLSLNLGFLNLLPIPVLDGGHIVFILIEAIIRRPVSSKTKLIVQQIGMAILLALMVFVIINDIRRIW